MAAPFHLPQRPKILVITLRRLGDVLLTTPLLRTLRRGFPSAELSTLVFKGSDRILIGNPDLDQIVTMPQRPTLTETLALVARLWRRYDLVVSTQAGDRPTFYSLVSGRRRVGLVPMPGRDGDWWKRWAHHVPVVAEPDTHRVDELRRLATALGLSDWADLVCPEGGSAAAVAPPGPYAVLHANPMYPYKRWSDAGWRELARGLSQRGLSVVATEGRDAEERAYLDRLWGTENSPVIRERGRLDWAGLAALLKGAAVYVGPDTSITHLAAGSGCPAIALYGPTRPSLVGPWPVGGLTEPWSDVGPLQRRGNLWLLQNALPCMPCDALGCERRLDGPSACLDELPAGRVLEVVDRIRADAECCEERRENSAPSGARTQSPIWRAP